MIIDMDQETIMIRLAQLLKERGDQILTDGVPLCLTASFLQYLDGALKNLNGDDEFCASFEALPGNSPRVPHWIQLQFLYDFVQKTPGLKVIPDSGSHSNADTRVTVASFRSLRELEVKRLPIHNVFGLGRMRGRLRKLMCSRCLSSLQDLLEGCGGDRSDALAWIQLSLLDASFNMISALDSSLRLLPVLQVLDLSHNQLQDAQNHLEHLTELLEVNLGYNMLFKVPTFSVTSHSRLTTLILQNNCLEKIEGIQDMKGLRQLDLANNCLMFHYLLQPLRVLQKLDVLILAGNPLDQHPKHRLLATEQLSPTCIKTLLLDRKPVTDIEYKYVSSGWMRDLPDRPKSNPRPRVPTVHRPVVNDDGDVMSCSESEALGQTNQSEITEQSRRVVTELASSLPKPIANVKKPGKRMSYPRRPRAAEISDIDDTGSLVETSSLTSDTNYYSSSCAEEQTHMKTHIKMIRNEYGANWLQAVPTGNSAPNRSTEPANQVQEISTNPKTGHKAHFDDQESLSTNEPDARTDDIDGLQKCADISAENSTEISAADLEVSALNMEKIQGINEYDIKPGSKALLCEPSTSSPALLLDDKQTPPTPHSNLVSPDRNGFSWGKTEQESRDYGPESEPFIVTLHPKDTVDGVGSHGDHFFVSVAERFLLEKNDEGAVIEALDLRCILSAQVLPSKDDTEDVVVQMLFDYFKKDRGERRYVMEDQDTAKVLLDLVGSFIDMKSIGADLKDRVKCLKCGAEFSKADRPIAARSLRETIVCPTCQSDMVVEMDLGQVARSVGHKGVMTSEPNTSSLVHEPTLYSTPVESKQNRQLYGAGVVPHQTPTDRPDVSPGQKSSSTLATNSSSPSVAFTEHDTTGVGQGACMDISIDSGITILRQNSSHAVDISPHDQRTSESSASDIAVLKHSVEQPSHSLSPILDPDQLCPGGLQVHRSPDLTPCGSLSNEAVNSMVSSVYEQSLPTQTNSESDGLGHTTSKGDDSLGGTGTSVDQPDIFGGTGISAEDLDEDSEVQEDVDQEMIQFSHEDYSRVDHRLKLHLDMTLFQNEELHLILQCDVVQYLDPVEYEGLLVITSENFYVLRINGATRADSIPAWLHLVHKQPLEVLCYVEIGYGGQSFRVETGKTECSFTFLIRDDRRCKRFLKPFTELVKNISFTADESPLEGIKRDQETPSNIVRDILQEADTQDDTDIKLYVKCHQQIGAMELGSGALSPVSIIVTPTRIAMATEHHHLSRRSADPDRSHDAKSHDTEQFQLKDIQLVSDLTSIEVKSSQPRDLSLTFADESTGDEYTWRLILATKDTKDTVVAIVKQTWEEMFEVDFQITKYA